MSESERNPQLLDIAFLAMFLHIIVPILDGLIMGLLWKGRKQSSLLSRLAGNKGGLLLDIKLYQKLVSMSRRINVQKL